MIKRNCTALVSNGAAFQLQDMVMADTSILGSTKPVWVPASDDVDLFFKGKISRDVVESNRRIKDIQLEWIDRLETENRIEKRFNTIFFTAGDSRDPELAGIRGLTLLTIRA